jgi:hypothetical protein
MSLNQKRLPVYFLDLTDIGRLKAWPRNDLPKTRKDSRYISLALIAISSAIATVVDLGDRAYRPRQQFDLQQCGSKARTENDVQALDGSGDGRQGTAQDSPSSILERFLRLQETLRPDQLVEPHTIGRRRQHRQRPQGGRLVVSPRTGTNLLQDLFPGNSLGS